LSKKKERKKESQIKKRKKENCETLVFCMASVFGHLELSDSIHIYRKELVAPWMYFCAIEFPNLNVNSTSKVTFSISLELQS